MSEQDKLREQLFDDLDAVEATTKQLTGDQSREAMKGQGTIIDGVNEQRYTVGTIPEPTAETAADGAAAEEPDGA